MRVSEMILIEAEALAHQNKGSEAAGVLNQLMSQRDPDYNKSSVTVEDVFLQKRLECWGESIIFYDYLRLKKAVTRNYTGSSHLVKADVKAGSWRFIYALPQTEIDNNNDIKDSDQNSEPDDL